MLMISDSRIMNNDIVGLTKTQISLSDSTCRIVEMLNLVYRKPFHTIFFAILQYLLATTSLGVVAGDFNFNLLEVLENNLLLNHFMEHVQIVNKPTHISGSLITRKP